MWEELAFYEGFASTWQAVYAAQHREDHRAAHHIRHLLEQIAQFPRVNPSAADATAELDILKLSRQIQSRYRALCATLGVKPAHVRASGSPEQDTEPANSSTGKEPVWRLENPAQAMSF